MIHINDDILNVREGIIAHQVNCKRVAGAGLALQIRSKYPDWYTSYRNRAPQLGICSLFKVSDTLMIASLYGQYGYGRGTMHTDYRALEDALLNLYIWRDMVSMIISFPFGMGCGLAGGDWDIVSDLIEKYFPNDNIYKLG